MYYGGAASWNLRDSHMAETLEHLLEARGPNAKAVVWAHNSHIGDARATDMGAVRGEHNIGQLARERWGDEVALIGFGTHTGTVSAASDWDGEREVKRVVPSRRDSYERLCHESGAERFLLDLHGDPALAKRLEEPLLERFIGVIYRPETERWSHYSEAVLPRQFDGYVLVRRNPRTRNRWTPASLTTAFRKPFCSASDRRPIRPECSTRSAVLGARRRLPDSPRRVLLSFAGTKVIKVLQTMGGLACAAWD